MTVDDRPDTTSASGPIASELAALLTAARDRTGSAPLISTTLAVGSPDPIDLFAAARSLDLEAVLWLRPAVGRSIVGIGRAWATGTSGPDRFAAASAAWRALLADALESAATTRMPESGPILLGGLGFSGRTPEADEPWSPFGPASLVLPAFSVVHNGGQTALTVAIGPEQVPGLDPGRLECQWEAIVRESSGYRPTPAGEATASLGGAVETGRLRVMDERPERAGWDRTVGLFAGAVGRGRIDKVVLARRVVYGADADLDVVAALRHLARTAPESTTFAFTRGPTTFLGASPERLVRTVGRSFETVAIAGSAARGQDTTEDARFAASLLASEKDREEHAVVVDMLRTSLTPIIEEMRIAETPAILPLRHVQHLATTITGRLRDEAGLLALAQRLHPTPAVGGAPRDMALDLIAEHEGFDRGWYAGPIGWLGADGDGELMVALRCGLVTGKEATLFAGCGIVADSDPEREWQESQLKLRTMIAALGRVAETGR